MQALRSPGWLRLGFLFRRPFRPLCCSAVRSLPKRFEASFLPHIETIRELLDRLSGVAASPDPLAELRTRGFTVAPEIQRPFQTARSRIQLNPEDRRRLAASVTRLGAVRFTTAGNPPSPVDVLPKGEYDVVVALRLAVLEETLAALYDGMRYPREFTGVDAAAAVEGLFSRERLEALSDDIPASAQIRLRLTAPLRVAAVSGTQYVVLVQDFTLELRTTVELTPGVPREVVVSSLKATARFTVGLDPVVNASELTLKLIVAAAGVEDLQLDIAADSLIQPRSAQALTAFTLQLKGLFATVLLHPINIAVGTVSPVVHLPVPADIDVRVHDIGVRTHSARGGDVIVIGVHLGTQIMPAEGSGDQETLRNPFTASSHNIYVRIHERMFRKIIKQLHADGKLAEVARAVHPDLRVDSADVRIKPNELTVLLDIKIVDVCGFPTDFIDVNVHVEVTFRFSLLQGQLHVKRSTNFDVNNWDILACALTEALQLLVLGAAVSAIDLYMQVSRFAPLFAGDGDDEPFEVFSAVFEPRLPVPGTEVLPRAEALRSVVREDRIEVLGTLSLRRDHLNTYAYVQFVRPDLDGTPKPLANAAVQLIDQDHPAPPADDAQPPATQTTTTRAGNTWVTREVTFVAPTHDEVLATAETDDEGRAQFVLGPERLQTSAGTVVIETRIVQFPSGASARTTSEQPLAENEPDVYFRVTPVDGVTFDTRSIDHGFVLNLRGRRIGSAAAPLVFLTGRRGR